MKKRYLTKSRFKVGCECATKLYFLDDKEFASSKSDNAFLEALAEGGFQIGELAKSYHSDGIEVADVDIEKGFLATQELLKKQNVTIFEAMLMHEDLLVRVDVLKKNGNKIELVEVKAKSADPSEPNPFYTKNSVKKGKPQINSEWEPYLLDIGFQKYVAKKSLPDCEISSWLMLADRTQKVEVDGLNQKFFLSKDESGRAKVDVHAEIKSKNLGHPILCKLNADEAVEILWKNRYLEKYSFTEYVNYLAKACTTKTLIEPVVGTKCKNCEFRTETAKTKLKSGFEFCWGRAEKLKADECKQPFVFGVWNFRKAHDLIQDGKVFIKDLDEDDVKPTSRTDLKGLSSSERQWIQIEKVKNCETESYLDIEGLQVCFKDFVYPLNFIDFETTMVAIPFNKGRRPYEQMAFQFSHHTVDANGDVEHKSEYINCQRGFFPNFEFVRNLKAALSQNEGSVFRYAAHENTVLCQIHEQLKASTEPDREELCLWIETITEKDGHWLGQRNMIDLCELVKLFYYNPQTKGSNSIKKVLPAILNSSEIIQEKFSKPIYGKKYKSKNYNDWIWVVKDEEGSVIDPYKLLPEVFSDLELEEMDSILTGNTLADGGAAMTAYSRMQFTQMSEKEAEKVRSALLKYCELDTFAMVMIYEFWADAIGFLKRKKAA